MQLNCASDLTPRLKVLCVMLNFIFMVIFWLLVAFMVMVDHFHRGEKFDVQNFHHCNDEFFMNPTPSNCLVCRKKTPIDNITADG